MKIISKHKDYYDYLVGYFGIDEHIVYTRKNLVLKPNLTELEVFAVAGKLYYMELQNDGWKRVFKRKTYSIYTYPTTTLVNKELNEPILKCQNTVQVDYASCWFPVLACSTPLPKIISDVDMYQLVYDFFLTQKSNKETESNVSDKQKIVNKGFDVKTSFRPKLK